jgi:hypothetical protein
MNDGSRLLDGELTQAELTTLLERLKHDAALRDEISAQQLIRDGLAGRRTGRCVVQDCIVCTGLPRATSSSMRAITSAPVAE